MSSKPPLKPASSTKPASRTPAAGSAPAAKASRTGGTGPAPPPTPAAAKATPRNTRAGVKTPAPATPSASEDDRLAHRIGAAILNFTQEARKMPQGPTTAPNTAKLRPASKIPMPVGMRPQSRTNPQRPPSLSPEVRQDAVKTPVPSASSGPPAPKRRPRPSPGQTPPAKRTSPSRPNTATPTPTQRSLRPRTDTDYREESLEDMAVDNEGDGPAGTAEEDAGANNGEDEDDYSLKTPSFRFITRPISPMPFERDDNLPNDPIELFKYQLGG